jgi:predicted RND superfamily exporter protein
LLLNFDTSFVHYSGTLYVNVPAVLGMMSFLGLVFAAATSLTTIKSLLIFIQKLEEASKLRCRSLSSFQTHWEICLEGSEKVILYHAYTDRSPRPRDSPK